MIVPVDEGIEISWSRVNSKSSSSKLSIPGRTPKWSWVFDPEVLPYWKVECCVLDAKFDDWVGSGSEAKTASMNVFESPPVSTEGLGPKGCLGFETLPKVEFFSPMLHEASHFLAAIHLPDLIDQPLRNTVCEFLPMCNIFSILDNSSDQSQAIGWYNWYEKYGHMELLRHHTLM